MTSSEKEDNIKALIVDGYVDEPSLLGVPPYISPEPRMLAGVLEESDITWEYVTADEYRNSGLPSSDLILVHGGVTVPGNYLSGTPLSEREAEEIASKVTGTAYLGGPLARYGDVEGYDKYVMKDLSAFLHDTLKGDGTDRWATLEEVNRWLVKGSEIVEEHPMFPDPLIAEVSMYRGCPRYFTGGCSFCSEPEYERPSFRDQEAIVNEVETLYDLGMRNFRLGGQSCVLSYKADGIGETEVPVPRPDELESLFKTIDERCPEIEVMHLDNANPAVIAEHPERAEDILKTLVKYTSPGNILAFGMETADPHVIEKNNLNANPHQVKEAIRLMNKVGRGRGWNGMPKLLPGINFLGGLKGERPKTYQLNFEFLKEIREEGLWIRRINIRQVLSHSGNFEMEERSEFEKFKERVRKEIDRPLLEEMFPLGTVLKKVYMEKREGKKTFGRQVGTYPLLVGVEYQLELGEYYDIAVTGYGYRSITGVHQPLYVSEASFEELQAIPGIGEKRAARIFREQPESRREIAELFQKGVEIDSILQFISFGTGEGRQTG